MAPTSPCTSFTSIPRPVRPPTQRSCLPALRRLTIRSVTSITFDRIRFNFVFTGSQLESFIAWASKSDPFISHRRPWMPPSEAGSPREYPSSLRLAYAISLCSNALHFHCDSNEPGKLYSCVGTFLPYAQVAGYPCLICSPIVRRTTYHLQQHGAGPVSKITIGHD